ncbi:hypothetical protein BDW59DRAFT_165369 [Aspergillus cavernicola]|uniref:Major facilitator superfamily (MFS) profile domain-containing protein n=1 Tax=Aspergillus cavernicola TaxID=176166 RepID=A0ABR4HT90_9EURO
MIEALSSAELSQEMNKPLLLVCVYASVRFPMLGTRKILIQPYSSAERDYNYWSGFLGMAQFKKDFGIYDSASGEWSIPSTWKSAATGSPTAGLAVGSLVSGLIGNRLGRVKTSFVSAVIVIVGF